MTATINNNSVSINMRDVLPAILRFNDRRELARYNGYTPTAFDTVADYASLLGGNANPLGAWANNADNDLVPRGSWVLDWVSSSPTTVIPITPSTGATQEIYIKFTVSEPLLLSPFIFADPKSNNQGFYGIQNMNFVFNIADAKRVWRNAPLVGAGAVAKTFSVFNFSNSELIFNFLTPHPSDLLPARNVVPFYELPRYITAPNVALASGAEGVLRTSNIQLNQIPDKLIVMVRKSMGAQTNTDPDFFLSIKNISLSFNNSSGILASANTQDLYRYSVENGSNQSWYEFSGEANLHNPAGGAGLSIPTSGSMLVLEFGKDINLVEDFYAPGSLGNFNIQLQMTVKNQTAQNLSDLEIVMITMNSGVFVCERGTSSTYTGILTKSDVLEASSQEAYTRSDVSRMVGGGFLDTLKSVAGKVLPKLAPVAKAILGQVEHPMARAGADVLGALGYAKPKGKLSGRLM
jgi:hypothetical protein